MNLGIPVDDLIAEIGRANDLDTVIQLERSLTAEVAGGFGISPG